MEGGGEHSRGREREGMREHSNRDLAGSGGDKRGARGEGKEAKRCETRGERALRAGRDRARIANLAGTDSGEWGGIGLGLGRGAEGRWRGTRLKRQQQAQAEILDVRARPSRVAHAPAVPESSNDPLFPLFAHVGRLPPRSLGVPLAWYS